MNQSIIQHFYESFQNKDVKAMQDSYADTAHFSDPVFNNLNASEVRVMWAMLLKSGKDLRLDFQNVEGTEEGGTAEWTAHYTFSATGNKVINKIMASFIIADGKIISHTDDFSFYNWAKQSLGITGLLLGWTPYLKNKIRKKAKANLEKYIAAT